MKKNFTRGFLSIIVAALFLLLTSLAEARKHGTGKNIETVTIPVFLNKKAAKSVPVDIFTPRGPVKGDLLVLPGWRFKRHRWYRETDLLQLAERYGYRAVFPEMHISLYASEYFEVTQSRIKWQAVAGGKWIREVMIPWIRNERKIFLKGGSNFLLGLSTGGRGVALVALQNEGLFVSGAALSGDYDQAAMRHDRLMTRMYGKYRIYKRRWRTVDNPRYEVIRGMWKMPLYLGHGTADRIVPLSQSRSFYGALKKYAPGVVVKYREVSGRGHDFRYWGSELPAIFAFFKEHNKK